MSGEREVVVSRLAALGRDRLAAAVGSAEAIRADGTRASHIADPAAFCFDVLPRHFDKSMGRAGFHEDLDEIVASLSGAKDPVRVALAAPRGEGKSTVLAFGLPLWIACHAEKVGIRYILLGRAHYGLASRDVEAVRLELESNERIRALYGDLRGKVWHRGGPIETSNGVRLEPIGMDQNIRGLRWTTPKRGSIRPELLILDDPDKDATSAALRMQIRTWLDRAILGLAGPRKPLHVIAVGTAVDTDALVYRLATASRGWRGMVYRAVERFPDELDGLWGEWASVYDSDPSPSRSEARAFYERNRARMDLGAEIQWEGDPLYGLMEYRHVAPTAFAAEKQNDPRDASVILLPPNSLGRWGQEGDPVPEADPRLDEVRMTLDPSMGLTGGVSGSKAGDFQAVIVGGLRGRHLVVLAAELLRLPIPDLCRRMVELCVRHDVRSIRIEDVGFQSVLRIPLGDELAARRLPIPVTGFRPNAPKPTRLRALEAPILGGSILIHRRHVALAGQLEALRRDGTSGDHDDGPDALHMLWSWLCGSGRAEGIVAPDSYGAGRDGEVSVARDIFGDGSRTGSGGGIHPSSWDEF